MIRARYLVLLSSFIQRLSVLLTYPGVSLSGVLGISRMIADDVCSALGGLLS
jgi:hypothetical protein